WDWPGGVQVHVRQLAGQLVARGHAALILAPSRGRFPEPGSGVQIVGRSVAVPYQGTVAPICFSPLSALRVDRALSRFRPDVVHAHEPIAPSTSMLAALRSRVPVVATFHAFSERSRLLSLA